MRFEFVSRLLQRRPPRAMRWRAAVAAALVLAAATLIWYAASDSSAPSGSPASSEVPSARVAPLPSATPATTASADSDPLLIEPALSRDGIERVEVCGAGWMEAEPDGSVDLAPILMSAPIREASERVLGVLRGGDDFARATAIALELASRGEGSTPLISIDVICAASACDATAADSARAAGLFDQLVKLASTTGDPRAYALAFHLCGSQREAGPCGTLNGAQWAHLDSGNGLPWLFLLGRAATRQDVAAIDDALYHLGAAARIDARPLAAAAGVIRAGGTSPEELLATETLTEAASALQGFPEGYVGASRSCAQRALDDANRRELCERAATALVERSDSIFSMRTGAAMGRRLGWPDARFDPVDATAQASYAMSPFTPPTLDPERPGAALRGPLDCASIRKLLRHVEVVGTVGERASAERWLERSGRYEEFRRRGADLRAQRIAREAAEATGRRSPR